MVEITCEDRWQAYRRLIELDIECTCRGYSPLQAKVNGPSQAIQVWSTTQCISQKRQQLGQRLERSWKLRAVHPAESQYESKKTVR